MSRNTFNIVIGLISAWILGSSALLAAENVSLRSAYLGDGLFKYEMTVHKDPFFLEERNSLWLEMFTNLVEVVEHSPDWQFSNHTNAFALDYPAGDPDLERPYSAYCIVRSANTNYCTVSGGGAGATVTGFLLWQDDMFGSPYGSGNAAFFARMEAIVPCSEEDADGSSSVCERDLELIPNVLIDSITVDDGQATELTFSWDSDCTVLIQISTNLGEWVDVGYALGSAPSTKWIAPEPLDTHGMFYRVVLAAMGHRPELIGGASAQMAAMDMTDFSTTPSFRIEGMKHGTLTVQIDTIPGARYVVSVKQARSGTTLKTIECMAQDELTRIDVDVLDLPHSATIEVVEILRATEENIRDFQPEN